MLYETNFFKNISNTSENSTPTTTTTDMNKKYSKVLSFDGQSTTATTTSTTTSSSSSILESNENMIDSIDYNNKIAFLKKFSYNDENNNEDDDTDDEDDVDDDEDEENCYYNQFTNNNDINLVKNSNNSSLLSTSSTTSSLSVSQSSPLPLVPVSTTTQLYRNCDSYYNQILNDRETLNSYIQLSTIQNQNQRKLIDSIETYQLCGNDNQYYIDYNNCMDNTSHNNNNYENQVQNSYHIYYDNAYNTSTIEQNPNLVVSNIYMNNDFDMQQQQQQQQPEQEQYQQQFDDITDNGYYDYYRQQQQYYQQRFNDNSYFQQQSQQNNHQQQDYLNNNDLIQPTAAMILNDNLVSSDLSFNIDNQYDQQKKLLNVNKKQNKKQNRNLKTELAGMIGKTNDLNHKVKSYKQNNSGSKINDQNSHFNEDQQSKRKRKRILNKIQRAEATMREKRRMLKLNKAFEELRKVLPISEFAKNKLSRAETLKSAIEYIEKMSIILQSC